MYLDGFLPSAYAVILKKQKNNFSNDIMVLLLYKTKVYLPVYF